MEQSRRQATGDRNKMLTHLAAEFELSEREKEALLCIGRGHVKRPDCGKYGDQSFYGKKTCLPYF